MVMKVKRKAVAKRPVKKHPPAVVPSQHPDYAAFLFVPGREFLLMGTGHVSIVDAQAHLEGMITEKFGDATEAWVVEVKSRSTWAPVHKWA